MIILLLSRSPQLASAACLGELAKPVRWALHIMFVVVAPEKKKLVLGAEMQLRRKKGIVRLRVRRRASLF